MLVGRLKGVLSHVISKLQSAFLPKRQILDGVLVIIELVDWAKRKKKLCVDESGF